MDASHIESVGMGRDRKKEMLSHYSIIPQCRDCHLELHRLGLERFEQKFLLNLYKLNQEYLTAWIYDNTLIGELAGQRKIKDIINNVG